MLLLVEAPVTVTAEQIITIVVGEDLAAHHLHALTGQVVACADRIALGIPTVLYAVASPEELVASDPSHDDRSLQGTGQPVTVLELVAVVTGRVQHAELLSDQG